MAHYIAQASPRVKEKVNGNSRYGRSKIIYYSEERKLTYTLYKKTPFSFKSTDKWFQITEEYEYRPDKVSYYYYGVVDFWWKIMEVNRMKDILEFKAGKNIRLPSSVFK